MWISAVPAALVNLFGVDLLAQVIPCPQLNFDTIYDFFECMLLQTQLNEWIWVEPLI